MLFIDSFFGERGGRSTERIGTRYSARAPSGAVPLPGGGGNVQKRTVALDCLQSTVMSGATHTAPCIYCSSIGRDPSRGSRRQRHSHLPGTVHKASFEYQDRIRNPPVVSSWDELEGIRWLEQHLGRGRRECPDLSAVAVAANDEIGGALLSK